MEVLNEGRLELIDDLVAKDFIGRLGCVGAAITGPDGVRRFVSHRRVACPDIYIKIEDQIAEDDRVVTRWRATAVAPAPLASSRRGAGLPGDHNHPPTGRKTGRRVHPVRVAVSSRVTFSQRRQGHRRIAQCMLAHESAAEIAETHVSGGRSCRFLAFRPNIRPNARKRRKPPALPCVLVAAAAASMRFGRTSGRSRALWRPARRAPATEPNSPAPPATPVPLLQKRGRASDRVEGRYSPGC